LSQNPLLVSTAIVLTLSSPLQASARELTLGAGAAYLPDHEGSDDYRFIPLAYLKYESEWITIRSSQLGLEADLIPSKAIEAGPIVRYDFGRDSDVDDPVVGLLPKVDESFELGAFVGGGLPLEVLGVDSPAIIVGRLSFIHGLDGGHEGAVLEGSLGLLTPLSDRLTIIASATASYMSENYADSYFGVSAAGSAASGLPQFDADQGFKDVGLSMIATYEWTEEIGSVLIGNYSRLIDDAADSPIVSQRGSEDQFFLGLGLTYTFR
jgi:outer membrane protein